MKRLSKAFPRGSVSNSGQEIGNNLAGRIELAHIACSLAANVSALLFEAEAAVSMEEE